MKYLYKLAEKITKKIEKTAYSKMRTYNADFTDPQNDFSIFIRKERLHFFVCQAGQRVFGRGGWREI